MIMLLFAQKLIVVCCKNGTVNNSFMPMMQIVTIEQQTYDTLKINN
jgi:hypothetical protein